MIRVNQGYKIGEKYGMNSKMAKAFKYLAIADKELRKVLTEPIML